MLLRFAALPHPLVLIFVKVVRRFFGNIFHLFLCIYSMLRSMTTLLRRDIFQEAPYL